ncbi:hypothetical protein [Endothiovibrio diazotrophicus]
MEKNEILTATRKLRDELPDLLGDRAADLQQHLDQLIPRVESDEAPANALLTEIAAHPEARRRLADHLGLQQRSATFGLETRSAFQPLPGQGTAIGAEEFVCPEAGCAER